jgi:hypothetical protein
VPQLPLLVNIAVALGYALAGGLLARRLGLPTIVGYLLAGVALGPFTPGFHGDQESIHQMAEFGVILLMFGVGLHFSFRDLWQVRQIVNPGAIIQLAVVTALGLRARPPLGFFGRRRLDLWSRRLGREHRRPDAQPDGPRLARYAAWQGRDRLAHRRGPAGRRHSRSAADDGRPLDVWPVDSPSSPSARRCCSSRS